VVKLKLPASIRIYPVVNVSRVVKYKGQKIEEPKPIRKVGGRENPKQRKSKRSNKVFSGRGLQQKIIHGTKRKI